LRRRRDTATEGRNPPRQRDRRPTRQKNRSADLRAAAGSYGERAPTAATPYVADELPKASALAQRRVGAATVNDGLLLHRSLRHPTPPSGRRYDLDGAELDIDEDEDDVENSSLSSAAAAPTPSVDLATSAVGIALRRPSLVARVAAAGGFSADFLAAGSAGAPPGAIDSGSWRRRPASQRRLLELAKAAARMPCCCRSAWPCRSSTTTSPPVARLVPAAELPFNWPFGPLVCLLASGLVQRAGAHCRLSKCCCFFFLYHLRPVLAVIAIVALCKSEIRTARCAFGVLLNVSKGRLGWTLLAWGNSVVGDLIQQRGPGPRGYPRMAISACFGGPMFNLLCCWPGIERAACGCLGDRLDFVLLGGLAASLCFT
uniref:Na_Ca_ex domain-containing protein n=1 Tax=Macrostomum lignano TaxID=282301 RepID=A0A1I8FHP9_9PLAT